MQVFFLQVIEIYCLNIYLHCIVPYINSFNCPYFLTTVYLVGFFFKFHINGHTCSVKIGKDN